MVNESFSQEPILVLQISMRMMLEMMEQLGHHVPCRNHRLFAIVQAQNSNSGGNRHVGNKWNYLVVIRRGQGMASMFRGERLVQWPIVGNDGGKSRCS